MHESRRRWDKRRELELRSVKESGLCKMLDDRAITAVSMKKIIFRFVRYPKDVDGTLPVTLFQQC